MVVFTSLCANYLPKAKVLGDSLKKHHPKTIFAVCLTERTVPPEAHHENIDLVVPVTQLPIEDLEGFIFKYTQTEASTAVKGYFFQELWRRYPNEDVFIFLDPDILILNPFDRLEEILRAHDIVLIPHLTEPENSYEAIADNEIAALKHGVFNLGFLGLRRTAHADRFLAWWTKRLHDFCFVDIPHGLFTDQRWVDLAPCFFPVHIFKDPGYDVAPWNLSRRRIVRKDDGTYEVNAHPLVFVHFSGWDSGANKDMFLKYNRGTDDPMHQLQELYVKLLEERGQNVLRHFPWSFGSYSNGEEVPRAHRRMYRSRRILQRVYNQPFDTDRRPSYYRYAHSLRHAIVPPFAESEIGNILGRVFDTYHTEGFSAVMKKARKYLQRKRRRT